MQNSNYTIGQTLTVKNREYTIRQIEVTADVYPNIKRNHPWAELHVILKGKRGALKSGVISTTGNVILF